MVVFMPFYWNHSKNPHAAPAAAAEKATPPAAAGYLVSPFAIGTGEPPRTVEEPRVETPDVAPVSAPPPEKNPEALRVTQRAEGWRLFTKAERTLVCDRWKRSQTLQQNRPADRGKDEAPLLAGMDASECLNMAPYELQVARDEIQRAAMMGDLDARYELLNERISRLKSMVAESTGAGQASAATPQEIAQLREELTSLANAGNRQAGFMMASALATGQLGVKDPIAGAAWLMASVQPSGEFDPELARRVGVYASASEQDRARLMSMSQQIYDDCCKIDKSMH